VLNAGDERHKVSNNLLSAGNRSQTSQFCRSSLPDLLVSDPFPSPYLIPRGANDATKDRSSHFRTLVEQQPNQQARLVAQQAEYVRLQTEALERQQQAEESQRQQQAEALQKRQDADELQRQQQAEASQRQQQAEALLRQQQADASPKQQNASWHDLFMACLRRFPPGKTSDEVGAISDRCKRNTSADPASQQVAVSVAPSSGTRTLVRQKWSALDDALAAGVITRAEYDKKLSALLDKR
jgi:hypothetical protein